MKNYKWEIIGYEILLLVIIFLALFVPNILARIGLSIILPIYAIILHFIMKKRNSNSIYQHQVVILMIIFALIYIAIFYILGFHFGFLRSKIIFSTSPAVALDYLMSLKQTSRKPIRLTAFVLYWCPGGDSNSHAIRRYHLKIVCLPIPPPGHSCFCIRKTPTWQVFFFRLFSFFEYRAG